MTKKKAGNWSSGQRISKFASIKGKVEFLTGSPPVTEGPSGKGGKKEYPEERMSP